MGSLENIDKDEIIADSDEVECRQQNQQQELIDERIHLVEKLCQGIMSHIEESIKDGNQHRIQTLLSKRKLMNHQLTESEVHSWFVSACAASHLEFDLGSLIRSLQKISVDTLKVTLKKCGFLESSTNMVICFAIKKGNNVVS